MNVARARTATKKILAGEREGILPSDIQHEYKDKYTLAQLTVRTGILSQLKCFEDLLKLKDDGKVREWINGKKAITLRFENTEKCEFAREVKRDVESERRVEKTTWGGLGSKKVETIKIINTVTDYFWKFDSNWTLYVYSGSDPKKDAVELMTRSYTREIKTKTKTSPKPKIMIQDPMEVNVTWIFQRYDVSQKAYVFNIDRSSDSCHTPRRNQDIEGAFDFFRVVSDWSRRIAEYFERMRQFFDETKSTSPSKRHNTTFPIVTAVFAFDKDSKKVFGSKDLALFEQEMHRSMNENLERISKTFPDSKDAKASFSALEARLTYASTLFQLNRHCVNDNVNMLEIMLYRQVVAAIGKIVTEKDFDEYMCYHTRKLYVKEFQPIGTTKQALLRAESNLR